MSAIVETLFDDSGNRRVHIIDCSNGTFSFIEEHYSNDPLEQAWLPQTWRHSAPICESYEIALREARGRVGWLRQPGNDA